MQALEVQTFDASGQKPFFSRWSGEQLGQIVASAESQDLRHWVFETQPTANWLQNLKNLLNLQAEYDREQRTAHAARMSAGGCTAGHLGVDDYSTVAVKQRHREGHLEWKCVCTGHSVDCFELPPKWRDRPGKVSAGREDEFVLEQCDGLYTAPQSGSAPYDGRLVVADNVQVSNSRRGLLDVFKTRGELILAVRAPKSSAERNADGSPSYACYKIEGTKGTPKRKTQEPGTCAARRRRRPDASTGC